MPYSKDPNTYSTEYWKLVTEPQGFNFPITLGPMPKNKANNWRFRLYGFLSALRRSSAENASMADWFNQSFLVDTRRGDGGYFVHIDRRRPSDVGQELLKHYKAPKEEIAETTYGDRSNEAIEKLFGAAKLQEGKK